MFKAWFLSAAERLASSHKGGKGQKAQSIRMRVDLAVFDDLSAWEAKWSQLAAEGRGPRYEKLQHAMEELHSLLYAEMELQAIRLRERQSESVKGRSEASLDREPTD